MYQKVLKNEIFLGHKSGRFREKSFEKLSGIEQKLYDFSLKNETFLAANPGVFPGKILRFLRITRAFRGFFRYIFDLVFGKSRNFFGNHQISLKDQCFPCPARPFSTIVSLFSREIFVEIYFPENTSEIKN